LVIVIRFLKCAFVLGLLTPSGVLAAPFFGVQCTHVWGLDAVMQVQAPIAAGPNAVQDTRKSLIDRFGAPAIERQILDGVALTWFTTEGSSVPIGRNVDIQIVQGTLHITCGITF
jgi:hypothetical protein